MRLFASVISLLFLILGTSCATAPPVQEMSDARQAIAAAREAGARQLANDQLAEAEALLSSAEGYLNNDSSASYWQAKKAALSAKEVAFEALLSSRNANDPVD